MPSSSSCCHKAVRVVTISECDFIKRNGTPDILVTGDRFRIFAAKNIKKHGVCAGMGGMSGGKSVDRAANSRGRSVEDGEVGDGVVGAGSVLSDDRHHMPSDVAEQSVEAPDDRQQRHIEHQRVIRRDGFAEIQKMRQNGDPDVTSRAVLRLVGEFGQS